MHRFSTKRPSPAFIVACIALVVSLGGTGYAALKLPKNSVGSKQLKRSSVTEEKVKDQSLTAKDFKSGELPAGAQGAQGPVGSTGPAGEPGAAGSAIAYARVLGSIPSPTLVANDTFNVSSVTTIGTGQYCLRVQGAPKNITVTLEDFPVPAIGSVDPTVIPAACPVGTNGYVATGNPTSDRDFYVTFN